MIWGSFIQVNNSSGIQVSGDQRPQSTVLLKTVHVHHDDCRNNYYNYNNPHLQQHHHAHHEYLPNYVQPVPEPEPEPEPEPIVYDYGSYPEPFDGRGRGGLTISMNNIRLPKIDLRRMLNRMPRMTISFTFD